MARHSDAGREVIGEAGNRCVRRASFCCSSSGPARLGVVNIPMKLKHPVDRIRVARKPRSRASAPRYPSGESAAWRTRPARRAARASRVLALLPRARARVRPVLQSRRHERRSSRALTGGRRDRPPADLEDRLRRQQRPERMFGTPAPARPTRSTWYESVPTTAARRRASARAAHLRNAEREAFDTLGLDIDAAAADIEARFKELVKRHHPDADGGDRSLEPAARIVQRTDAVEVGEVLRLRAEHR